MRRAARVRGAGLTFATVAAGWLERFETMARLSNGGCGPWRATGTTSTATYFLRWNDQIAPIAVYDIAGLIRHWPARPARRARSPARWRRWIDPAPRSPRGAGRLVARFR
jgi:hypothetical protein